MRPESERRLVVDSVPDPSDLDASERTTPLKPSVRGCSVTAEEELSDDPILEEYWRAREL